MRVTAGLLLYCDNKIVLVQEQVSGKYSIPKGEVHEGETYLNAAIRETEEECGITISKDNIIPKEYFCSIDIKQCSRKLFYYKATISLQQFNKRNTTESKEIKKVILCNEEEAISLIQTSQVAVLWKEGSKINLRILNRLVIAGWINKTKHPSAQLYIYDYTNKCKRDKAWNIVTLWCRGLIVNNHGDIIAYPLKKFFEYRQLFTDCRNFQDSFEVSEKIDGFLGITYFLNGYPYIATRNSFISPQAIKGTSLLYLKHLHSISKMNLNYSYIFEIVYPNNLLVLNYGTTEDLFLIDIIDNKTGKSVIQHSSTLSFQVIKHQPNTHDLQYYLQLNEPSKEGLVLKFPDGNRLKIKYSWFKEQYIKKNGE